jgi:Tfp pilus assembly protein PilO|tara:strand:+ start:316 stop:522 length:207 start_codon:yes stop_codon:yes gene_type:complete
MNKLNSTILWVFVILTSVQLIIMDRRIKKIERIIQESLDNEPIEIKIEGSWEQFGKLTFNDRVLTKDD